MTLVLRRLLVPMMTRFHLLVVCQEVCVHRLLLWFGLLLLQSCFEALKAGADSKRKKYGCVVWVSKAITKADLRKLDDLKDVVVLQDTPVRVCHRRSLMTRRKIVHDMATQYVNAHFFLLELTTSAGAYVKEFVHGDRGRTVPSVGSLLVSRGKKTCERLSCTCHGGSCISLFTD